MAIFSNYATLSYNGRTTNSNTVTGEILETLTATKTAVSDTYNSDSSVTYVISLVNNGTAAYNGLTITDDLGAYTFEGNTVYPLEYADGSALYYVNGVLQSSPSVTAGPPLVISGINVPAGSNATIVYEANVTDFAPLAAASAITNSVTVTGSGLSTPVTASETITAENSTELSITKSLSPTVIEEDGQLTYTFVIENNGNTATVATDNVILTDTFDPILNPITVIYEGTVWTEGVNYTYNAATGEFATLPGQITVPAATYTQNPDGTVTVTPGTVILTVTGTV